MGERGSATAPRDRSDGGDDLDGAETPALRSRKRMKDILLPLGHSEPVGVTSASWFAGMLSFDRVLKSAANAVLVLLRCEQLIEAERV